MFYGNTCVLRFNDVFANRCFSSKALHAYRDSLDHVRASREDGVMRKLILILLLGCSACSTQAQDPVRTPPSGASAEARPAGGGETLARIRALVGDASCTHSGQCRTLPIGAMACGGPEDYLPYSESRTDEKALRALGEKHKAERLAENKASGLMSICRYLPDPGAVCTSGRCQLGASSPSQPSAPVAR